MIKEKRILSYFIGWLLLGFIICFIGLSNVSAATYYLDYSYYQKYFDNSGSSLTGVSTTWNESLQSYVSGNITTAANSYGAGLSITSPIPIIENHTYTLSLYFVDKNNIALSSKNYLSFSSTLQGAANNYANGEYDNDLITSNVSNNSILNFAFTARRNGSYIFIPWTTTSTVTQSYVTTQIIMEDLGSEGVSINEVNNSLNNQTNELNNSIQNSTNIITGEINDMEQSIVDSNKETQDVIKDQFNNCRPSENLINYKNFTNINSNTSINIITNGLIVIKVNNSSGYGVASETLSLKPNTTYTIFTNSNWEISKPSNWGWRLYNVNDESFTSFSRNDKFTFTTNNNTEYILYYYIGSPNTEIGQVTLSNIMLNEGSTSKTYEPYGEEICSNKIDETNNQLGNLNDSLNNSNVDGSLGDAGSFFDNFSTTDHGGLSGIITAPLVAINQMLNTSCSPMTATFRGKELSLPCGYEFWNRLGAIQDFINIVLGGMLCYRIIIKLYKLIERIKNPEDDRLEVMDL